MGVVCKQFDPIQATFAEFYDDLFGSLPEEEFAYSTDLRRAIEKKYGTEIAEQYCARQKAAGRQIVRNFKNMKRQALKSV